MVSACVWHTVWKALIGLQRSFFSSLADSGLRRRRDDLVVIPVHHQDGT